MLHLLDPISYIYCAIRDLWIRRTGPTWECMKMIKQFVAVVSSHHGPYRVRAHSFLSGSLGFFWWAQQPRVRPRGTFACASSNSMATSTDGNILRRHWLRNICDWSFLIENKSVPFPLSCTIWFLLVPNYSFHLLGMSFVFYFLFLLILCFYLCSI